MGVLHVPRETGLGQRSGTMGGSRTLKRRVPIKGGSQVIVVTEKTVFLDVEVRPERWLVSRGSGTSSRNRRDPRVSVDEP